HPPNLHSFPTRRSSDLATSAAARTTSMIAVDVLMFGACANAALVILQVRRIWSPFVQEQFTDPHYASGGFLGNTNYVGTFLAARSEEHTSELQSHLNLV